MKPVLQFSRSDQPIAALPADSAAVELEQPVLYLWLFIAALSLVLGVTWRISGNAPNIPAVLDGAGLVLWLAAPWLATAWDRLLRRQLRHVLARRERWSWRLANVGYMLLSSLLLSLAPLALVLAYDINGTVAQLYLQDPYNLELPAGLWIILSLVFIGPLTVIISTLLLHLMHWLFGWRWGFILWLLLAVVANAPIALGGGPFIGLQQNPLLVPLSMGQFAAWAAAEVARTQAETLHLQELIATITSVPLRVLLAALILGLLFQSPVRRLVTRIDVIWCAMVVATTVVAARAAWQTWLWAGNPSRQLPEDHVALFGAGLICAWLVWWLTSLLRFEHEKQTGLRLLSWCSLAVAAWVCLTLPQLITGQAVHAQLLITGAVAGVLLIAGILLIYRVSRLKLYEQQLAGSICAAIMLLVLILPLPIAGKHISPALYGFRVLSDGLVSAGNHLYAYFTCAALAAVCFVLWPFERKRKRHYPQS